MRKQKLLVALIACAVLFPVAALARQGTPPLSRRMKAQLLQAVQQRVVAPTDVQAEKAEDARIGVTTPLRFAVPTTVEITPETDGTWEQVPGGKIWRLRVTSDGATDLNFGFSACWLPEGATLHVYSEDQDYFQGPYSARDNKPHGQLWTPLLPGGRAVIELFVPSDAKARPRLVLSNINRGYRDMFHPQQNLGVAKAGSCNNDVICPVGDPWRNEIRSVAVYSLEGQFQCSGTLINDVPGDLKNYFLTANHCRISGANAASIVVYWNYQSPTCALHGGGSLAQNQSGAVLRMAKADVDVTLIELDDIPDPLFNVYYSGWDRSGATPAGAVGIHHPGTDEKSISFANSALATINSCIGTGGSQTHWGVIWNSGVTEPGSSGSGLWDPNTHRLIGTLSGGDSDCARPNDADCYGKFSVAWNLGGTPPTRLRDWLDPLNTGVMSVPGRDSGVVAAGSVLVSEHCAPPNGVVDPGEMVTVRLALQNFGRSNSVNLVATLLATNGVIDPGAPQNYGVVVSGGPAVVRDFSLVATGACGSTIMPTLQLQDGTTNLGTVTFAFRLGTPVVTFIQFFDNVVGPNLPAGWSNFSSGSSRWITTNGVRDTAPNSAFASDPEETSDTMLTSPPIAISGTNAQLMFAHNYFTEWRREPFDGGVLEIAYNGGPFNDIITAGGRFISGGYNATISTDYSNPIKGRPAWSGNSGGFVTTLVNLPNNAAGQNVRLRWRMATDESNENPPYPGWYVDTISISDDYTCCAGLVAPRIVGTRKTGTDVVFSFDTVPGQTYVTEFKTILSTNTPWVPLRTNTGDAMRKWVTNSTSAAATGFFRVRTY
jgi:hypothetical protein